MKEALASGEARGGELFGILNLLSGYCDAQQLLFKS